MLAVAAPPPAAAPSRWGLDAPTAALLDALQARLNIPATAVLRQAVQLVPEPLPPDAAAALARRARPGTAGRSVWWRVDPETAARLARLTAQADATKIAVMRYALRHLAAQVGVAAPAQEA